MGRIGKITLQIFHKVTEVYTIRSYIENEMIMFTAYFVYCKLLRARISSLHALICSCLFMFWGDFIYVRLTA